jgi:hypothetical protein
MKPFKNVMEVFKLLEKSNCRACDAPTCLAFAAAVFKGERRLDECPRLDRDIIARYGPAAQIVKPVEDDFGVAMAQLGRQIAAIDLASAARRIGAEYGKGRLTLKVLGKDFSVDTQGRMSSDIHIHGWIALPVLNHILNGTETPLSGNWISFRELKNGPTWYQFFNHQCEKRLKQVADTYTDLFEDMIHIFNGKPVANHYQADISLVLRPLPKLPMLICYWKPEDGLASSLNLFFDATAEAQLPIESIYALGTGLVVMFEKIALRHG